MQIQILLAVGLFLASPQRAPGTLLPPSPASIPPAAKVVGHWRADEARQGVAVDDRYFYAVTNNAIGKYDKQTGKRVARWQGSRERFPHINSCAAEGARLICAASNFPGVPMASVVEIFDKATMKHVDSVALPPYPGSLTWIERHDGSWFALFANYDGRHSAGGRDHRWTLLMQLDDKFQPLRSWRFPRDILADFAPMSCSGGSWNADGLLYVTGHSRSVLYALRLPDAGTVLDHVATISLPTTGQAFAWDPQDSRVIWTIDRDQRAVYASRVPAVPISHRTP